MQAWAVRSLKTQNNGKHSIFNLSQLGRRCLSSTLNSKSHPNLRRNKFELRRAPVIRDKKQLYERYYTQSRSAYGMPKSGEGTKSRAAMCGTRLRLLLAQPKLSPWDSEPPAERPSFLCGTNVKMAAASAALQIWGSLPPSAITK